MKPLLIKILKGFLIVSVVMLGIAMVFGGVLVLGWPWWVGFFVLIGLAGLAAGILFINKLLQRNREQHFVQQVIHQEAAYVASLGDKDKERSQELQDRWKEAMDALRASHLKKMGNPLYVLPWYMIIGESGSGKTTSIKSARLSSPFAEVRKTSGISGTRNCDWWFFEQAIIIDTAGRYAIPVDEGRDKEEWQRFLSLLVKFRKREPLNGLIITIAADKLLSADPETLLSDGRSLRQRVDELMRVLGAKFPVYILVTKCDLIQGMTQYCQRLPEKALDRAMGYVNHDLTSDISTFTERAMHTLVERLKDLRLQLLHQPHAGKSDPALLLFPEEFERIKAGLSAFSNGAFQANPYQETPILRGIFFSSGRQEGSPYSHFLKSLGLIGDRDVLPGTNTGMFLFDFFSRILPGDRRIFSPTLHAVQWRRLTRNLGLTAWVAIGIALCGLLSYSFVKNMRILKEFSHQFTEPPVLRGDLVSDVMLMDRFRETLLQMEERNHDWWLPRFYLNQSREVEIRIKEAYCKQVAEGLIGPYDKRMAERISGFSSVTPCPMLGHHLAYLIRRINLLQARLSGADLTALQAQPQPGFETLAPEVNPALMPELQDRLVNLYQYDLIWQKDANRINQESIALQTWMKQLLSIKQNDLSCLVDWVNSDVSLKRVTLSDFWGGEHDSADSILIEPAYTLKGKEAIDRYILEIESAISDPIVIAGAKQAFQKEYEKAYLNAWEAFAARMPEGVSRLSSLSDWHQIIDRIGAGEGPYFSFLGRMQKEIAPFSKATDRAWIGLVHDFCEAKLTAAGKDALPKTGLLSKAAQTGKNLLAKVEKTVGDAPSPDIIESKLLLAATLGDYQKALAEISKSTATRKDAYEMAAKTFGEGAAAAPSPFLVSQNAIRTLKANLSHDAGASDMFWALVSGPQELLWDFVCRETACYLDKEWEEKVLVEVEGISDPKKINAVAFGEQGPASDYVKGPIAPFIDRSLRKGYYAKNVLGREIQLKPEFLTYLTQGAKEVRAAQAAKLNDGDGKDVPVSDVTPLQFNGIVTIKALPTDVNPDAHTRPQTTTLSVQCGSDINQLINLNYPVRKAFEWSSETCDEVVFTVEIGSIVLTKRYKGKMGFPLFLSEFGNGTRRLYPLDFPQDKRALEQANIKYIQVNYRFEGHSPVLVFYRKYLAAQSSVKKVVREPSAPKMPRNAAICWEQ